MATTDPVTTKLPDFGGAFEAASVEETPAGTSPGRLALRRLRRNKIALGFGLLFLLLVG